MRMDRLLAGMAQTGYRQWRPPAVGGQESRRRPQQEDVRQASQSQDGWKPAQVSDGSVSD